MIHDLNKCPICDAEQKFARKKRHIDPFKSRIQEVFVECNVCHNKTVIGRTTPQADSTRVSIVKLKQMEKRGFRVGERLAKQRERLAEELNYILNFSSD